MARASTWAHVAVRRFETDPDRARELSEKLEHVTVLQADPTDPAVYQEEHIENCDAFVAVSGSDEHNILGALQAREMGVKHLRSVNPRPVACAGV